MRRTRALSGLVLVLLAVGGGVSHYAYFQETVWWTTPHTQAVNLPLLQGDRLRSPLVMALPMLDNYLPLSYSLDPATPVILLREDEAFLLPRDQSAYLYMPPPWLLSQVRKMNGLMVMELGRDLWRVTTARDATPG